jgi:ADP-ribose pyrophosphatase
VCVEWPPEPQARVVCEKLLAMRFHDFIRDGDGWKLVGDETLFANPYLEVHRVHVTTPTRSEPFAWTVTHRKGAVVVVPVPIRATIWEFPAGQIDDTSDPDAVRATGLRELVEESGHELAADGELSSLGLFFPSAGFTDEHSHLLLAQGVVPAAGGARPDAAEAITECRAFSAGELRQMVATGEIRDANSLAAFARMCALGLMK